MYEYFEIAYALAGKSLCLFLGTGFSKHITNGDAPTWRELLDECCDELQDSETLKKDLFSKGKNELPLEECAQIIELELQNENKDIREIIAHIIGGLEIDEDNSEIVANFFDTHDSLKIITTNYDDLIETALAPNKCNSYCPGKPIPKLKKGIDVYHIHGSIEYPKELIVTAEDYYNFINNSNYYRDKIYNLIQDFTTIIIGYSLGDPNLKPIFYHYSRNNLSSLNRSSLFYVTRKKLPLHIKDYYEKCYGLRVLDRVNIPRLIGNIENQYEEAVEKVERIPETLRRVLEDNRRRYKDKFLKLRHSFFQIISSAEAIGESITSKRMKKLISNILKRKIEFTGESGAWEQYDHLAEWLVYLGSVMDIKDTSLQEIYLKAVSHSMETMSREHRIGYCWEAYVTWKSHWESLTRVNRTMIKEYVSEEEVSRDALKLVNGV